MYSDSDFLLLAAVIVSHRWLTAWAACNLRSALIAGMGLLLVLAVSTPVLVTLSAVMVQAQLSQYLALLAVVACVESWVLLRLAPGLVCLSPISMLGIVYLLLLLFQSGALSVPFAAQTMVFCQALLVLCLLYRFPLQNKGVLSRSLMLHAAILWFLSCLSFGEWPEASGLGHEQYIYHTVLLLVLILQLAVFATVLHVTVKPLFRRLRGEK